MLPTGLDEFGGLSAVGFYTMMFQACARSSIVFVFYGRVRFRRVPWRVCAMVGYQVVCVFFVFRFMASLGDRSLG